MPKKMKRSHGFPQIKITTVCHARQNHQKIGDGGEDVALTFLEDKGLRHVTRNYRTPGRGGGEIDLLMRDPDGTLVFVEVRKPASDWHGGAAASVGFAK